MVAAPVWNPDYRVNRQALIFFGLCLVPIYAIADHFGHPTRGAGGMLSVGILLLTLKFHWTHRHYAWYWVGFLLSVLMQIPFVLLFPPLGKVTLATMLPMGTLDYIATYAVLRIAYLIARKTYSHTKAAAQ